MNKKFRLIFNLLSLLFLSTLVVFYGYRLIYFYKLEHTDNTSEPIKFYQKLINNKGIEGMNYGLQKIDKTYVFAPESTDNYLYFLGRNWRIIGVDENNNIKAITDESQTILSWEESLSFDNSNIYTWLKINEKEHSGLFEKSLKNNNLIVEISLLTKKEYEKIGNGNFLVDKNFWIINEENNIPTYINNKGEIINETNNYDTFNIKPTILISSDAIFMTGHGTINDPYIIYNYIPEKLTDVYVGEYLNYNNNLWRVIEVNENDIKVVLDGYLDMSETIMFSDYTNEFNLYDGIGYYLNNDFYEKISNNDYIVEKEYFIGNYNNDDTYSYLNVFDTEVLSKIGLYQIGEFFINEYNEIYTLTPSNTSYNAIYTINNNNNLYIDLVTNEYKIRPTFYLDGNIFILDGIGTKEKPYKIGR